MTRLADDTFEDGAGVAGACLAIPAALLVTAAVPACSDEGPTVRPLPAGEACAHGGYELVIDGESEVLCTGTAPDGPVITSVWAERTPVSPGERSSVHVTASAEATGPLSYRWRTGGDWELIDGGETADAMVRAPDRYGAAATISVTVSDTARQAVTAVLPLATVSNRAPTFQSVSVFPQPLETRGQLSASVADDHDPSPAVAWEVGGVRVASGTVTTWTHPGIPANYRGRVVATDDAGRSAVAELSVELGSQAPWPAFGRDAQRTGRTPYSSSATGSERWSFFTGDNVASSPAIGPDGVVYFGSSDGNLYAVEPDGTQRWSFPTGGGLESSPAVASDGAVYVGSGDGNLYAINPDGTQRWAFPTAQNIFSSPAIAPGGTIYVGSYDGNVYAIDPDGNERWRFATGGGVASSPAIADDGTIYIGSNDENLYALRPDGSERWSFATTGNVLAAPAVAADGTIYVTSTDGNLYAVNPDGTERWAYPLVKVAFSSPAIGPGGTIYVGTDNDRLHAVNPDGTERWSVILPGNVHSPAVDADGTIYVGSDTNLFAFDPDGTERWFFPVGGIVWPSPAIGADGILYVGSHDQNLYAVE